MLDNNQARKIENDLAELRAGEGVYYAKNSYAPNFSGVTTPGTITYTSQMGYYIVIEKICTVWGMIMVNAISAAPTGNLIVTLPFASAGTYYYSVALGAYSYLTLTAYCIQLCGRITPGDAYFRFVQTFSGAAAAFLDGSAIASSATLSFSCSYLLP
jgi:hypothetical protein